MFDLREYRTKEKSYADLVGYAAMVADGVLLQKDGSLLAGWYYQGEDMASASADDLNIMAVKVNNALKRLGTGWMVHATTARIASRDYPECKFPDRTSRQIERERRAQYQAEGAHYETISALVLSYMPPLLAETKIADSMVHQAKSGESKETQQQRLIRQFGEAVDIIENDLRINLKMTRMRMTPFKDDKGSAIPSGGSDALLRWLHYNATGKMHPVRLPETPMYLDTLIASEDFVGGFKPKVGDQHIRVISITGLPGETSPAMLDAIGHMQFPMRWTSRFIFLDPALAVARIDKIRKKWKQGIRGFKDQMFRTASGAVNLDALAQSQDAEIALSEAKSGQVRFGYYTSTIVLMDDDAERIEENVKQIRQALGDLMLTSRIETVNAVEAFLGTLPGNGVANVRRTLLHTFNLSHLMPLTSVWSGPATNPCPFYRQPAPPLLYATTTGGTPFRLSLHQRDVGHTLIAGITGAGKSTLLGLIAAQHLRYKSREGLPAQVFAFDKGNSMFGLAHATAGVHYEIAGDASALKFAPLDSIDSESERLWAQDWLEGLLTLNDVKLTTDVKSQLTMALKRLANSPRGNRSLSEFISGLQNPELRQAIAQYTDEGGSDILDAQEDSLHLTSGERPGITVFEMEDLLGKGPRIVVPTLMYIFHRVEKALDGRPTLLILDEAWVALSHPVFAEKIKAWLKVLRKANAAVIFATQSIA
ncbi:hypothetical protein, partial [Acidithiobacillus sp.]|uniref:VirB4 family type IV secretion/conjugal transfer ATPase n=1 Tax=Acidithiobacillus sp. TaxID=1872118 RepID=UPI003CFF2AA6